MIKPSFGQISPKSPPMKTISITLEIFSIFLKKCKTSCARNQNLIIQLPIFLNHCAKCREQKKILVKEK